MTIPCRSCASCERELSAVRLELQAAVRERDQYRDALEQMATCEAVSPGGWCLCEPGLAWAHDLARAALGRERKDTPTRTYRATQDLTVGDVVPGPKVVEMDAGERKDTNA